GVITAFGALFNLAAVSQPPDPRIMRQPTLDARRVRCLPGTSLRTPAGETCGVSTYRGGGPKASIGAEWKSLQVVARADGRGLCGGGIGRHCAAVRRVAEVRLIAPKIRVPVVIRLGGGGRSAPLRSPA